MRDNEEHVQGDRRSQVHMELKQDERQQRQAQAANARAHRDLLQILERHFLYLSRRILLHPKKEIPSTIAAEAH